MASGTGTALLDFGAFPGKTDVSLAVTGQATIGAAALAEAWIWPVATVDHSADEHAVEALRVFARDVVAGTGFTIQGVSDGWPAKFIYGKWTIAWAWNG